MLQSDQNRTLKGQLIYFQAIEQWRVAMAGVSKSYLHFIKGCMYLCCIIEYQ